MTYSWQEEADRNPDKVSSEVHISVNIIFRSVCCTDFGSSKSFFKDSSGA
jgi:hypothetical protein